LTLIDGGKPLWWRWTAPSSRSLRVDTFGSSLDTTLGSHTGTHIAALTIVASNNGSGGGLQGHVGFDITPGTEYYIAVDRFFVDFDFGTIVRNGKP
jgi:hypothetical protein